MAPHSRSGYHWEMAAPPSLQRLAADLAAEGIASQYLQRVLERVSPDQQLETLQAEIAQEMAQALGKSEDRVNLALAELELRLGRFRAAERACAAASELQALADAYNAQRHVASARLRELLIHREAIGFRRNQLLQELYPIPPKLVP